MEREKRWAAIQRERERDPLVRSGTAASFESVTFPRIIRIMEILRFKFECSSTRSSSTTREYARENNDYGRLKKSFGYLIYINLSFIYFIYMES